MRNSPKTVAVSSAPPEELEGYSEVWRHASVPFALPRLSIAVGSRFDGYCVEALISRSRFASVFRCTDSTTGGNVALKVLHAEAENDKVLLGRFYREQKIGAKLDHPGLVKVLGLNPEGSQPYVLMEWARGASLRAILDEETRLPKQRAIRIALALCDVLEYIHSNGVVHRDLKPENIMVDAEDRIKLLDFGIAGQVGARRLTFGNLSHIMGTPDYISPEQLQGRPAGARSDIYSLGVILYEMLTGQLPFSGVNPFAIMNERLVKRPQSPRVIVPGISLALQAIMLRALEPDPRKRYQTARTLAFDFTDWDRAAGPAGDDPLSGKRRRRQVFILCAMVALIPAVAFLLLLLAEFVRK